MASRKTCTPNRGFTLIEVLVVLGIFACVAGVLAVGPDLYRGYSARNARNDLVVALMHARAESMDGVCLSAVCASGQAHGIYIDQSQGRLTGISLFEGSTYEAGDALNSPVDVGGMSPSIFYAGPAEVSFAALSGDASPATLTLGDGHATSTVTIGSEGQITWTH